MHVKSHIDDLRRNTSLSDYLVHLVFLCSLRVEMAAGYGSSKAEVFVRIRPENKKEQKYKAKGNEKFLADYTSDSVTIGGRKGKTSTKVFEYPRQVLGPSCSQEEAYVSLGLDNLLNKFLFNNQDACVLAYGQTGNA